MNRIDGMGLGSCFLTALILAILAPATAWAHGMSGLGAVLAGIFIAGPICVIQLVFNIILIVFLAGDKRTSKRRVFSRVVQVFAAAAMLLYPIITYAIERTHAGVTIGIAVSGAVWFFSILGFSLAQVLASKCKKAEHAQS